MKIATGFITGLSAFVQGGRFMRRHPRLWHFALTPIIINILISLLALGVMVATITFIIYRIHPAYGGSAWWWGLVEVVYAIAMLLAATLCAIALYIVLGMILCGIFYARLAEEVEVLAGVPRNQLRAVHWAWQVSDGVLDLAILLAAWVLCMAISFVPFVGQAIALCLSFAVNFYILGAQYFDFSLMPRGIPRHTRRKLARRHLPETLGLGSVVFFLQFVPILGAIVLAMHVVGATLIMLRLEPRKPPVSLSR